MIFRVVGDAPNYWHFGSSPTSGQTRPQLRQMMVFVQTSSEQGLQFPPRIRDVPKCLVVHTRIRSCPESHGDYTWPQNPYRRDASPTPSADWNSSSRGCAMQMPEFLMQAPVLSGRRQATSLHGRHQDSCRLRALRSKPSFAQPSATGPRRAKATCSCFRTGRLGAAGRKGGMWGRGEFRGGMCV